MPFTGPDQKKAVMQMLGGGGKQNGKSAQKASSVDPQMLDELVQVFSQLDADAMTEFVSALEGENPDALMTLADSVASVFGDDSEDSADESDSSDEEE